MDLTNKDGITPREQLDAAYKATSIMVEYMGSAREAQRKQDKSLRNQNWMMIMLLFTSLSYIGTQIYHFYNPTSTEIDRRWIQQQQATIETQRRALYSRESRDSAITAKNTADALINLKAQEALAVDRAAIAIDRASTAVSTLQLKHMQDNSIKRDSLFNQKKTVTANTVNANTVNTVNGKIVNVKK